MNDVSKVVAMGRISVSCYLIVMIYSDTEILTRLETIGEQDGNVLDLGETALLLANLDLPKNNFTEYRDQLDLIASDMSDRSRGANTLADQTTALSDTLYTHHGYRGDIDSYDDPQNANLMRVIDRRKGLPVALGILVIHAGRSRGWDISGLNFPGHFLLRLTTRGEHALIDPFDNARLLIDDDLRRLLTRVHGPQTRLQADFIRTVSDQDILFRLQNNIKTRALVEGDRERAIKILETMTLIGPARVDILAELAMLESTEGRYQSALGRLDLFIARNPDSEKSAGILNLKENLKRRLN